MAAAPAPEDGVVAEYTVPSPLSSISLSRDQRHGVVGGRELMKVIRLKPDGLSEIATLKIGKQAGKRNNARIGSNKLSMYDVAWCHSGGAVAASLSNGGVALWDLEHVTRDTDVRGGGDGIIIGTHDRSVNRLGWKPHDHTHLLSGSQDGCLKLWDTRAIKDVAVYKPKSEAVRDVQFNPLLQYIFAAVFENGKLQIWDQRFPNQPFMKIVAHSKTTISVEWHHTMPWRIATGSHDRTVKIWDLIETSGNTNNRASGRPGGPREKQLLTMEQTLTPTVTIMNPAPVSRAKWRPGHENQIAMAQLPPMRGKDVAIQLQDVYDPSVPLAVVQGGDDQKNGFVWLDTPMRGGDGSGAGGMGVWQHIVSCSELGTVRVHSLAKSGRPRKRLSPCAVGVSSRGEIGASFHSVDRDPGSWGLYRTELTQAAHGMFREYMPLMPLKTLSKPQHNHQQHQQQQQQLQQQQQQQQQQLQHQTPGGDERRRVPSGQFTPHPPISQAQRIARSLSVGDQTSGTKGRRAMGTPPSGPASSAPTGGGLQSRSPVKTSRGPGALALQMPPLTLSRGKGSPVAADAATSLPCCPLRGRRGQYTVWMVDDPPVVLDASNWHRTRGEGRYGPMSRVSTSGINHGMGPSMTEFLAMRYAFRGDHIRTLCANNVKVCIEADMVEMAYTWRMLSTMLAGVPGGVLPPLGSSVSDVRVAAAVPREGEGGAGGASGRGRTSGAGRAGQERRDRGSSGEANGGEGDDTMTMPRVLELLEEFDARQEQQQQPPQPSQPPPPPPPPPPSTSRFAVAGGETVSTVKGTPPSRNRGIGGGMALPPRRPTSSFSSLQPWSPKSNHMPNAGNAAAVFSESGSAGGLPDVVSLWDPPPAPAVSCGTAHGCIGGEPDQGEAGSLWDDEGRGIGGGSTFPPSQPVPGPRLGLASQQQQRQQQQQQREREMELERRRRQQQQQQRREPDEYTLDFLWRLAIENWLYECSEQGDIFHVVALCEVVRCWYYGTGPGRDEGNLWDTRTDVETVCEIQDAQGFWLGTKITNLKVREWYVSCIDYLRKLQLHVLATEIIENSDDAYIAQMLLKNTTFYTRCGKCGTARNSGSWCSKCSVAMTQCVVCHIPVTGVYVECPGCHHGGHLDHLKEWFAKESICAEESCDHMCIPRDFKTPSELALSLHRDH